jgi:O-antigen/teichoic acid export membrane protein
MMQYLTYYYERYQESNYLESILLFFNFAWLSALVLFGVEDPLNKIFKGNQTIYYGVSTIFLWLPIVALNITCLMMLFGHKNKQKESTTKDKGYTIIYNNGWF